MTTSTSVGQVGLALVKPRFLIALAFLLGVSLLTLQYFEQLGSVYQHIPTLRGSRLKTTAERMAISEKVYQESVENRHIALKQGGYGTENFNAWNAYMNWWWYFQAAFSCPHEISRIGNYGDGGKWICGMSKLAARQDKTCVVYSLGISGDSSFEEDLMKRTNCEIWAFDASVEDVAGDAKNNPRIHFQKVFVGAEDKIDDKGNVWKSLKTIMKENGHTWIDIIKMDIESSEFSTMDALMKDWEILPFSQLQVEMHLIQEMDMNKVEAFPRFLEWFERLEKWHLRPFWNELNLIPMLFTKGQIGLYACEFSFINTAGNHLLVSD